MPDARDRNRSFRHPLIKSHCLVYRILRLDRMKIYNLTIITITRTIVPILMAIRKPSLNVLICESGKYNQIDKTLYSLAYSNLMLQTDLLDNVAEFPLRSNRDDQEVFGHRYVILQINYWDHIYGVLHIKLPPAALSDLHSD